MAFRIASRWVFPVSSPPIPWGCITISDGKIVALSNDSEQAEIRLEDFAILPGLVNAHTHLDLSLVKQIPPTEGKQIPPTEDKQIPLTEDKQIPLQLGESPASLPQWLHRVIEQRRQTSATQTTQAIRQGIEESLRCGVTTLCDISVTGASYESLHQAPLRSIVCYEVLGLNPLRIDEIWSSFWNWFQEGSIGNAQKGISPHAPYSTHREFLVRSAKVGLPLTIHLAESGEEQKLLESRTGKFVEFLQSLNVWYPEGIVGSFEEVLHLIKSAPKVLLAHANYLLPVSIPNHMSVIYCPRTHAHFRHSPYPLKKYLQQGVNVALGTDSRASNPDLDLFAEMQYLVRIFPDLGTQTILSLGTKNGAIALGYEKLCGTIEVGKSADLVAVSLPKGFDDPDSLLSIARVGEQRYTLFQGQWRNPTPCIGGTNSTESWPD